VISDTLEVPISAREIAEAAARIAPYAHETPVFTSRTLDERVGASVFLKCENLQRAGAFKFRGALNALLQLDDDERKLGVITHSSGNHAQALALAGQLLQVPVCVVMPRTAPAVKRAATAGYGAEIIPCEPTLADREATVAREIQTRGFVLVHPFDDWRVIAGQGTAALELLRQTGALDLIITPCGGGGLLSGTALWVSGNRASTKVIGAEPANADDAHRSLASGRILPSNDPKTIADGLRTSLGTKTFALIRRHVSAIVTAQESEIVEAMRFLWERLKLVVEPSAAVPLACLLNGRPQAFGSRVGVIVSGGNVDLASFFDGLA
jgi:threonine dehydratase